MRAPDAASSDLFRILVENSADGVSLLDDNGRLLFASASAVRMLGHPLDERLGRPVFDMVHADDLERVMTTFAACLARPGEPIAAEYRVRHKDGSWHVIESVAVNRLEQDGVSAIVVNFRDITDRKGSKEALHESQERLRQLVERAEDIIYYCDLSGRFTYANPTAGRVMQYASGDLIGRHFLTLIRPDYHERAVALYKDQLEARTPNTYFEFPAVTRLGDIVWLGQHVQLVMHGDEIAGVQAIARDITRQKIAEERLRQSEARYRSLIHGAAYGIYRTLADGTLLDANPALAHMLGYASSDELQALNMVDIYERPHDHDDYLALVTRGGDTTPSIHAHWKRKDGTPIVVRLTARFVTFAEENLSCFEGIAEDVTERRALEQQLRRAQRMEAVGLLARGVAHDFNNVLAAILGSADLLMLHLAPEHPAQEEAQEIVKAAERGAMFTRKLLAFSSRQVHEPRVLDAHEIVAGMEPMLRRLTSDGIELRLHTPGPTPFARVDAGDLEQILLNLVVNSRDAMPAGGAIDITVESMTFDATAARRYPGLSPGAYVRVSVHDSGVGIAPDVQPHLFEPFFTTKNPATGTGLGLSIVYSIAKEAGGTVTVHSTPERGTTFDVLLPTADPTP